MSLPSTQTDATFIDILKTKNVPENFSPYRAENTPEDNSLYGHPCDNLRSHHAYNFFHSIE
jgi:hypothetical protein